MHLLSRMTMLESVQFDAKLGLGTVEIQKVSAANVLSAKFEPGESSGAKAFPKFIFFLS